MKVSVAAASSGHVASSIARCASTRGGRTLYFVPPETIASPPPIRHDSDDRSLRMPRRGWLLIVEKIEGQVAVLTVQHAGTLGPTLDLQSNTLSWASVPE